MEDTGMTGMSVKMKWIVDMEVLFHGGQKDFFGSDKKAAALL